MMYHPGWRLKIRLVDEPIGPSVKSLAMSTLEEKVTRLRNQLRQWEQVVVCFSGGVDSSFLLAESVGVLNQNAVALTAVSPSLAQEEGAEARHLAQQLGARHLLVETHELDDPRYAANPVNRCYFCKTEMYATAVEQACSLGIPHVLDGFNVDDRSDHRPGRKAAREYGVRSPLDELGFTKSDIREAARRIDLPVWDKPALACLSSRFPYGTPITPERLTQVGRCERVLRQFEIDEWVFERKNDALRWDTELLDPILESSLKTLCFTPNDYFRIDLHGDPFVKPLLLTRGDDLCYR